MVIVIPMVQEVIPNVASKCVYCEKYCRLLISAKNFYQFLIKSIEIFYFFFIFSHLSPKCSSSANKIFYSFNSTSLFTALYLSLVSYASFPSHFLHTSVKETFYFSRTHSDFLLSVAFRIIAFASN